jgi:hypothetical protein
MVDRLKVVPNLPSIHLIILSGRGTPGSGHFSPVSKCPLLADFRRSGSASGLVKSNANDWSSRMQMGGQVHAITQKASNLRLAGIFIY